MLITTFDVLRKRLKNRKLFEFATAFFICDEAQTAPPSALMNKYANAAKILEKEGLPINGFNLLKTTHFLTESELASTTSENIAKAYLTAPENYFTLKPQIENALNILTDARILLFANNAYRITSDLETKLLDEMNELQTDLFIKKRNLITYLKKSAPLKHIAGITEKGQHYSFHVISDSDDEILVSSDKYLQIKVYSLFSVDKDREDIIETVKRDTQYEKSRITLIPQNGEFNRIDRLLQEIQKSDYMLEKYGHDANDDVRQIIGEFAAIRNEKKKELICLIDLAYTACTAVYLFDTIPSDTDTFAATLNSLQQKVIKNVYTKRPSQQLSEKSAWQIVKEKNAKKLCQYNSGNDYFSYKEAGAADIFKNSRNFQKTNFKALTKTLTAAQKDEIVNILLDLKYKELTGAIVDWNTYDFQLAEAIRTMADKN